MTAPIIPFPRPPVRTVSGTPLGPPPSGCLECLPLAMQAEQDAVHVLVGNDGDGIELSITPGQARAWGAALFRLADAAEAPR